MSTSNTPLYKVDAVLSFWENTAGPDCGVLAIKAHHWNYVMRYRSAPTRRPQPLLHALALAAALAAGSVQAQAPANPQEIAPAQARPLEESGPAFSFRGFGTLGVAHSDYDQADYSSSVLKRTGAGGSESWSPDLDSRLGVQLDVKFNKKWSAVVQVITEQRYDASYRPMVEWGNIKYQATPDLALRVGRIAIPIFLAADYRKVGYAYPWVRTPVEVYGGVPITNNDGADVVYRWRTGSVKHVTQAFFGRTHLDLTDTTYLKASKIAGITHTAEYGATTLRASAFTSVLDTNILRFLFDDFRKFGPRGIAIAEKYDVIDKRMEGVAIGVNYDPGQWFIMAEGGVSDGHSYLGKSRGVFVSSGYRTGEFTPYLTYSRTDALSPTKDPGLPTAGLPPALAYAAGALNYGLDLTLKTMASQTSVSAGVRWDFHPNMALKLQYDRVMTRNGSRGTLVNLEPGFKSGRPINVTSATLDFVF